MSGGTLTLWLLAMRPWWPASALWSTMPTSSGKVSALADAHKDEQRQWPPWLLILTHVLHCRSHSAPSDGEGDPTGQRLNGTEGVAEWAGVGG